MHRFRVPVLFGLLAVFGSTPAVAQGWSVAALGGQARSDVGPFEISSATAAVAVRYGRGLNWATGTVGIPVERGEPVWAVLGGGGRLDRGARFRVGADLSGHLFAQEDRATLPVRTRRGDGRPDAQRELSGVAGVGLISPFLSAVLDPVVVEGHVAVSAYRSRFADVDFDRMAVAPTLRVYLQPVSTVALLPEARWMLVEGEAFPEISLTAAVTGSRIALWARAGHWAQDSLAVSTSWGVGATLGLTDRIETLLSAGRDAFSPLYGTGARESWSLGMRVRLGSGDADRQFGRRLPEVQRAGTIRLALTPSEVVDGGSGDGGAPPRLAGDFNGWVPEPMGWTGEGWSIALDLGPGAYHYAFVAADGTWFVPEGRPGRVADGFGGWSAVLVVEGGH